MRIILLIAHLFAIATGTGMSIANYVNIRIAAGEKGDRQASLVYLRRVLARFADVILAAIFLSGIGLYYSLPPTEEPNSWIMALFVAAAGLLVCHVAARLTANRMAATGDNSLYSRMEMLVSGVWLCALASIVFAVLAFET